MSRKLANSVSLSLSLELELDLAAIITRSIAIGAIIIVVVVVVITIVIVIVITGIVVIEAAWAHFNSSNVLSLQAANRIIGLDVKQFQWAMQLPLNLQQ